MNKKDVRHKPRFSGSATLAARLLAIGSQRLRASETATALTFQLPYAAKWVQAMSARRGGGR